MDGTKKYKLNENPNDALNPINMIQINSGIGGNSATR